MLGAGDAFLSGFLRGYLRGEQLSTCATWANACGAFAVSRLLCSPECPTWDELQHFLRHGSRERALRKDETINHIHWATTRRPQPRRFVALAATSRRDFEEFAGGTAVSDERLSGLLRLAVAALGQGARGEPGHGIILDQNLGREALFDAARLGLWIGRPAAVPGLQPDFGSWINEWPISHTVLVRLDLQDPAGRQQQCALLAVLHQASRKVGRELMIEIAGKGGVEAALAELYRLGIRPDWWLFDPQDASTLEAIEATIARHDPWCRGVALRAGAMAAAGLVAAAGWPLVRGLVIGVDALGAAPRRWLAGEISDADATAQMAEEFASIAALWKKGEEDEASGAP